MAKQLQLRRGTTAQHSTFTGAAGEVTIDTDKKVVVVHDGSTAGGTPLAKDSAKVDKVSSTDNAIVRFNGTSGAVQNSSVVIDDYGNVGIGVTPSAWNSNYQSLEFSYGAFTGNKIGVETDIVSNAYRVSDGSWYYKKSSNPAGMYAINDGSAQNHRWLTAPSGTAGNAISWTTAMTLDASGDLNISSNSNFGYGTQILTGNNSAIRSCHYASSSGTAFATYLYNASQIGSITQNGTTAVAYNTTSDHRLKENVRPANASRFNDIEFVDFEWVDGRHDCGVIAHQLQSVYPDLVIGEKDATEIRKVEISPAIEEVKDEDGNIIVEAVEAVYEEQEFPVYQQVNYIGLISRIGTVVQQQAKLIDDLKARIEALEAK